MWAGDELSNQGKEPGEKERMNFDVVKELATDEELPNKLRKYFEANCISKIVLFGFGYVGKALLNSNKRNSFVEISQIIDSNQSGREYRGYCIKKIEDYIAEDDVFVVTAPFFFEEIEQRISSLYPQSRVLNIAEIIKEVRNV